MCLLNFAVENETLQNATQQNDRLLEEKLSQLEETLTGVTP